MGNITIRPINGGSQKPGSGCVSDASLVHTKLDAIKIQKDRYGLSAEMPCHMLQLRFKMRLSGPVTSKGFLCKRVCVKGACRFDEYIAGSRKRLVV